MLHIPKLTRRISPKTVKVWRLQHLITACMKLFILFALLFLAYIFYLDYWILLALYIVLGSTFIKAIYQITLYPVLLQRTWRYQVNDNNIQTSYGFFHTHHTIIPIDCVINVHTYDGPLLRKRGLVKMTIKTLTSSVHIPGLVQKEAIDLQENILKQINVHKQKKMDEAHE